MWTLLALLKERNVIWTVLASFIILLFYWHRQSRGNKTIKNINAESMKQLYENKKTLIKVDEYNKGGVLDTQNLEALRESNPLETSFVKPDGIQVQKKLKSVLVFWNPAAGVNKSAFNSLNASIEILKKHSIKYVIIESEKEKHFVEYLKNTNNKMNIINKHKVDVFIVIGGDGTYNEFINGYILGGYTEYNIPIMFIPGGRYSNLYQELVYNKNVFSQFEECLIKKEFNLRYIDLMKISNTMNEEDMAYSVGCTLFGVTTQIVEINEKYKPIFGKYAVHVATPIALLKKDIFRYKLIVYFNDNNNDKCEFCVELTGLFCCKTKRVGHVIAAPVCKLDNGFMDICIFLNASRYHFVKLYAKNVTFGTHILNTKEKKLIFLRCKKIQIIPMDNDKNDCCTIDGEMGPYNPCIVETIHNVLPVITM